MRGVVEIGDFNTTGCCPLPAAAISPSFEPLPDFYPFAVPFSDYHEFLFRMKRFTLSGWEVLYANGNRVTNAEQTTLRHPEIPEDVDERTLMLWPGLAIDDAAQHFLPTMKLVIGFDDAGLTGGFGVYGQSLLDPVSGDISPNDPHPWWPPIASEIINSAVDPFSSPSALSVADYPAVLVDVESRVVWPRIIMEIQSDVGGWRSFLEPMGLNALSVQLGYRYSEEPTRLQILEWGTMPLYKLDLPGSSADITAGGTITLSCVEWYERRDANGRNPIWDADTGRQLITPIPRDTSR